MGGWLARLKNEKTPETYATKPTKPPQGVEKAGFVGFVASHLGPFQKIDELLHAAMRACAHWGDDDTARQQMLEDCRSLPPEARQEWLERFLEQYPSAPAPTPIPAPPTPTTGSANEPTLHDWHELDRAYLNHHLQCTQCLTAGKRRGERCAVGAALWRDYEAAEPPFFKRNTTTRKERP